MQYSSSATVILDNITVKLSLTL